MTNKFKNVIKDIEYSISDELEYMTFEYGQKEIKDELKHYIREFPMLCMEYTEEYDFLQGFDESKFLNDESHDGCWIAVINSNDDIVCVFNLIDCVESVILDVFEVNQTQRGKGIARDILKIIESHIFREYDYISLSAFDGKSERFWEHMDYKRDGEDFIKTLLDHKNMLFSH